MSNKNEIEYTCFGCKKYTIKRPFPTDKTLQTITEYCEYCKTKSLFKIK